MMATPRWNTTLLLALLLAAPLLARASRRDLRASNQVADPVITDPAKPADPVTPVDPAKPADPVTPVDPAKPADPVKPVDPAKPADPVKPEDPKPVDPVKPADPVTTDPVRPTCQPCNFNDPKYMPTWSSTPPTYACPFDAYSFSGAPGFRDSCGNDYTPTTFLLQRRVGGGPWADVGTYDINQLADKNLYVACGSYQLVAYIPGCSDAKFTRLILVREVDTGTFNDPRLDQAGKTYCPSSAVVPSDLFGTLTAKVVNSDLVCQFPITAYVLPFHYPDSCQTTAQVTGKYLICPATVAPVASPAVEELRTNTAAVFEALTPSDGWAAVTTAAPDGMVVYQCPGSNVDLGALTLTSKCPGRGPYTPPLTYGGDYWQLKKTGCGMGSATGSQCGQTFGRKIVQDIDSIDMPATTGATVCPGAPIPATALPPTTTASILGAPAGTPKCTAQGQFDPQSPLGTAPNACGVATVTRTYNACSKSILAKVDITVTETFGGFDPVCPLKYTTSCPGAGTIKAATLVGAPVVSDANKCEFLQPVEASVCGGANKFKETYKFNSCTAIKL